ncbi:MBL fold metallo-hydrolase [Bacillus sp. 165]|uniref:MBL fold metallo-hydrolase n=1 Tax=Bacillus sp. 165 TaxID=1529117 RepID=UPI001AD967BE|nr:MBL fold metallo-hydrolase [Bacillus sp. 165]MBO9128149.1 MBL fold metallo-hydrolase [Bacillus sp. 165]
MTKLQFLGTSDAKGVPRILCGCKVCTEQKEINIRTRPSLAIHTDEETILIDLSPDYRTQCLRYLNENMVSTVLLTHAHNDHITGLGDYSDALFGYGVKGTVVSPPDIIDIVIGRYPYLQNRELLEFAGKSLWKTGEYTITFHRVNHGHNGYSYGIKFMKEGFCFAYVSDAINLTSEELEPFVHLDLLIIGTSFWDEQAPLHTRSVYSTKEVMEMDEVLQAKQIIFTHLSHDIDVEMRSQQLPSHMMFAYDGMQYELN